MGFICKAEKGWDSRFNLSLFGYQPEINRTSARINNERYHKLFYNNVMLKRPVNSCKLFTWVLKIVFLFPSIFTMNIFNVFSIY